MNVLSRRLLLAAIGALSASVSAAALPAGLQGEIEADEVVFLWPDGPPGGVPAELEEKIVHRENPFGLADRAAHDVTAPSLSVFRPLRPDGSAILIIPGGGYKWVVVDKEGFEGARHFSGQGATVYVLRYRLPHQGWQAGSLAPLEDAQRAMRTIRARATEDGVDPGRVLLRRGASCRHARHPVRHARLSAA